MGMNTMQKEDFLSPLHSCRLCPRSCGVDRTAGQTGFCRAGALPRVALASLHQWEEPCLSGTRGSGAIFFSRCNLACVFCQNHPISQQDRGADISIDRLAAVFLEQQHRGAHNLNLVTPTPYVPQIIAALSLARESGFTLPVVYNTSAYDNPETIEMLRGWVDIYLPDLKYCDDALAVRYSRAPGYFSHALRAIDAMIRQVVDCVFDDEGLLQRGVLIRHLALPGQAEDSRRILRAIRENFGPDIWFSLMNQYTPQPGLADFPELAHPLTAAEYEGLIDFALSLGLENGFIQEGGAASESFIPFFNLDGVITGGNPP
jgi:putative pyruvate formate lyase activating enzyme